MKSFYGLEKDNLDLRYICLVKIEGLILIQVLQ